jgi:hypothetical protein
MKFYDEGEMIKKNYYRYIKKMFTMIEKYEEEMNKNVI